MAQKTVLAAEDVMSAVTIVIIIAIAVAVPIVIARRARGKNVECPRCGAIQPTFRKPNSFKQLMWGGYTCQQCGTAMDRNGQLTDGT
jgi:transposase-like protein